MIRSKIPDIVRKRKRSLSWLMKATGLPRTTLLRFLQGSDLGKVSLRRLIIISGALKCKISDLFEIQH